MMTSQHQDVRAQERTAVAYPSDKSRHARRRWLRPDHGVLIIVSLFVILGIIYTLATPVLEASDEFKHYPYVQYVQTHRELPVLDPEVCRESVDACPWLQDGGQPPAYYAVMAAATSWIDTADLSELLWRNKHAFIGDPGQICNKNLMIHQPGQERFPWTGSVLAIHLIRLLTLAFGAGTVILTYHLSRNLFPGRPALALGATASTALNPMFLFVSSSVNNDAMAAFVGNLGLLMIVRIPNRRSQSSNAGWSRGLVLLGVVIGLGVLTKLSLLAMVPLALLVVGVCTWRENARLSVPRRLLLVVGDWAMVSLPVLAISAWWFLRNWRLYGDPTALNAFIAIQGRRPSSPTLADWLGEFGTFRWTYWGLFGAVNVMAPRIVYWFFDLLSLAGLIGFVVWGIRRARSQMTLRDFRVLIPALWAALLFISVLRWTWVYYSFQGRLVFPGIAGISVLMMWGLRQWVPERHCSLLSLGMALILLVIATLSPIVAIRPAYARPSPLTLSQVPENARVEPVRAGGGVQIVGWELSEQTVRPEETNGHVDVVVYWQADAPVDGDYVSFAHLLGRDHELVGEVNRHPACGMVPTSLWESGQVWRDPYRIPVADGAAAPSRLRVEAGLYAPEEGETLATVTVGEAKLAPPESTSDVDHPLSVKLADGITFRGYDLAPTDVRAGETITVTLHWKASEAPSTDYQVFVHLLGDDPEPVAQGDGPPLGGYYPTSMWSAGETLVDPHRLSVPADQAAGSYRLLVGMYDLETMKRLRRSDGGAASIEIPTPVTINLSGK
jgi:4-amino-4-deoxy-L-arabinose transferase-like glycosyltransferase